MLRRRRTPSATTPLTHLVGRFQRDLATPAVPATYCRAYHDPHEGAVQHVTLDARCYVGLSDRHVRLLDPASIEVHVWSIDPPNRIVLHDDPDGTCVVDLETPGPGGATSLEQVSITVAGHVLFVLLLRYRLSGGGGGGAGGAVGGPA